MGQRDKQRSKRGPRSAVVRQCLRLLPRTLVLEKTGIGSTQVSAYYFIIRLFVIKMPPHPKFCRRHCDVYCSLIFTTRCVCVFKFGLGLASP